MAAGPPRSRPRSRERVRRVKFGIVLPTYMAEASVEGIQAAAQLAERLGYESIWTSDHVMVGRGSTQAYHSIFEALSLDGWLAALTTRVKLGVSVLVLPQRNAVLVAKEVATLDRLSGG